MERAVDHPTVEAKRKHDYTVFGFLPARFAPDVSVGAWSGRVRSRHPIKSVWRSSSSAKVVVITQVSSYFAFTVALRACAYAYACVYLSRPNLDAISEIEMDEQYDYAY